ncbi:MAG: Aminodeoxychorismate synthase [Crocinitomicaceae bacterium]|jgi:para-aminobenzoate synthetase component 1|nr:Aminodeoxychorismate synthase [Crocinitomicaceae bacterium]
MFSTRIIYLQTSSKNSGILALGCEAGFTWRDDFFGELDAFIQQHQGSYLFSCLSYDLKNRIERLESNHQDLTDFPEIVLWKAEVVVEIDHKNFRVLYGDPEKYLPVIHRFISKQTSLLPQINFQAHLPKTVYLEQIAQIKREIQLGNIYELNFCQQFSAELNSELDSVSCFQRLSELTQAPFSAYVNLENHEVFCGSPERFIQKKDNKVSSQPIKGTSKRGENEEEDRKLIRQLQNDPKERAENIMITDLVRNDLSRIASKNSVHVDELCGVYTFGTVHQLISTISCTIKEETTFSDILKATFPMGSMTGAPKIRSMELIEKYENFKRGLYSGSIGYFKPNGDFDFNVVIRSLIRNKKNNVITASVGGAITIQSDPEQEYRECEVKIHKLLDLFKGD